MNSIRLLPIVIFAIAALLLLKGIGLVTGGGYLLSGVGSVQAAGGGGHGNAAPAAGGHGDAEASDGVPSIDLPSNPTLHDKAPTLDDHAPTLAAPGGGAHGGAHSDTHQAAAIPAPVVADGAGTKLLLSGVDNSPADTALLQRLGERRAELDAREADLAMRLSLVEAAERRIAERSAELAALEARVSALVDEKSGTDQAQFKAVLTMYEAMKPRDAAGILNALDIDVLVPIVRGISPRKMAPILAAMEPRRAQEVTARLASGEAPRSERADPLARSLPQIIGQ